MQRIELSETLLALLDACQSDPGAGVFITEVVLDVPIEIAGVVERDRLVFFAAPPHTRWKSGVLPAVHRALLRMELIESDGELPRDPGGCV